MPEHTVQTLLTLLCQSGALTTSLGSLFWCPTTLCVKNLLFLISNPNLYDSASSSPLTGHQRAEIGACPTSSPHKEALSCYEVFPQSPPAEQAKWPCSLLIQLPLKSFATFVALLWMVSNTFTPFLCCGTQTWPQHWS